MKMFLLLQFDHQLLTTVTISPDSADPTLSLDRKRWALAAFLSAHAILALAGGKLSEF